MKKAKLEQLDEVQYKWFPAWRAEGKPVSGMIIKKAKDFFYLFLCLYHPSFIWI